MPDHRPTHSLADDQADPHRVAELASGHDMKHQRRAGRPTSGTHRGRELSAAAHAMGRRQHRVRQRGGRGPCGGARTGSSGRRGCAYEAETRGSWPDDGCWAGTYASTRGLRISPAATLGWSVSGACRDGGGPHRADMQRPTVQRPDPGRSNRESSRRPERLRCAELRTPRDTVPCRDCPPLAECLQEHAPDHDENHTASQRSPSGCSRHAAPRSLR